MEPRENQHAAYRTYQFKERDDLSHVTSKVKMTPVLSTQL